MGEAYSNDRFSYIKVNGNTIDLSNLKKDSTGQYYYDVSLGYRNLEIEAMAMDDAGNKALATKSFTGKFPWPIGIVAACFVCILKLLKHE